MVDIKRFVKLVTAMMFCCCAELANEYTMCHGLLSRRCVYKTLKRVSEKKINIALTCVVKSCHSCNAR